MTLAVILAFAAVITYFAFRNAFFGLKLMAGMAWIALFIYMKGNPPGSIVEGSGEHTALLVIAIGFAFMIVLSGLGRGISRTTDQSGVFSVKSEGGFHFKMPDFLKNSTASSKEVKKREKKEESLREYEERVYNALHPSRRNKR